LPVRFSHTDTEGKKEKIFGQCSSTNLNQEGGRINMKLFITRDQAKGLLGGVKFELRARVELTNEEAELVRKYKAQKETLLKKEVKIPFTNRALIFESVVI
jgi:hypothetical protein